MMPSEVFWILHGDLWSRIWSMIEVQAQRMKMMMRMKTMRMTKMKSLRRKRHQRRYFDFFLWSMCTLCFVWHIIPHQLSVSKFFIITWRLDQARKDLQSLFQKHLFLIRRQNLLLPKRLVSCLDFELCSFSPLERLFIILSSNRMFITQNLLLWESSKDLCLGCGWWFFWMATFDGADGKKSDDKKSGGHVATPYPSKQAGKTPANTEKPKQQVQKSGGSFSCKSCNRYGSSLWKFWRLFLFDVVQETYFVLCLAGHSILRMLYKVIPRPSTLLLSKER